MAYDENIDNSSLWQQYYTPEDQTPYGYQAMDNLAIADALRNYTPPSAQEPTFIGLDQQERLKALLAQKQDYKQPTYQQGGGQMKMPDISSLQGFSGFAPSAAASTPGTASMDFSAPFGSTGGSLVNAGASSAPMTGADFAGSSASTGGGNLMDFGSSFGSTGSTTVAPGTASTSAGASPGMFGNGGSLGGGWASAAGGALNGYMAGRDNYVNDPNMWSGKDGYGKYHKDYRAEVGGGTLGGVMGYWGGPVGAALAGPVVKAVHPYAEKGTRSVINFGDKVGGAGGALMLDPIGTVSTGKYSWGELGKGALLGPLTKLF